jgi:DNA-binding transcriptional ArsR family regulator
MNMSNMEIERMNAAASEASELLLAIANPKRLMILCHLLEQESTVTRLAEQLGMNQPAVSQQLARLRALRLVSTRREAQQIFYRVSSPEIRRILETLYDIYCTGDAGRQNAETSEALA